MYRVDFISCVGFLEFPVSVELVTLVFFWCHQDRLSLVLWQMQKKILFGLIGTYQDKSSMWGCHWRVGRKCWLYLENWRIGNTRTFPQQNRQGTELAHAMKGN